MKRFWLQWCLSRALDEGKPLPDWLERELERDPQLRAYASQAQRLSEALRRDASLWMEPPLANRSAAGDNEPFTVPKRRREIDRDGDRHALGIPTTWRRRVTVAALAATFLIACLMFQRTPSHDPRTKSAHSPTMRAASANRPPAESAENARILVQWIDAGRRAAAPWTETAPSDVLRDAKLPTLPHRLANPYAIAQRTPETIGRCSMAIGGYLREEPRRLLVALKRVGHDLSHSTWQCSQRLHSLWKPSF